MITGIPSHMEKFRGRDIYLWGAGRWGRVIGLRLAKCGLKIAGYLDSNAERFLGSVCGYQVARPEPFLASGPGGPDGPILVVTPHFFKKTMLPQAEAAGFVRGINLFTAEDFTPHHYIVEISGKCNLRCLACSRGRKGQAGRGGLMSLESFRRVLEKITAEDPLAAGIQLYQWGEPLLNPDLPQIIEAARLEGLPVSISSNLNLDIDLEPAVAAGPDWFRVSLSGFGRDYERTHVGGNWERLKTNMRRLAEARDRSNSRMCLEAYYHIYAHNQGEQMEQARLMCRELGFEFQPVWAYLIGLEEVLNNLEGRPLPPEAEKAAALLAVKTPQALEAARRDRALPCPVENMIMIDWDTSVPACLMYYGQPQHRLAESYLHTPLAAINKAKKSSAFCVRCREQAMHRYCDVYYHWPQPGLAT